MAPSVCRGEKIIFPEYPQWCLWIWRALHQNVFPMMWVDVILRRGWEDQHMVAVWVREEEPGQEWSVYCPVFSLSGLPSSPLETGLVSLTGFSHCQSLSDSAANEECDKKLLSLSTCSTHHSSLYQWNILTRCQVSSTNLVLMSTEINSV